ncbi:MAG TPA: TetR/AcrR family transcriptional regulator, partial [Ilumatobacteraceae bacterium]|nr:TetR/AcrR family transcriptional regulator [Ilumatobacteraceae bacterium]
TRPYLRAADRRRQLLEAVGRLFDRSGFGDITVAGVAAEAGVSRQLVYDHFDDLGTLCDAFVEARLARYRADLPEISALRPDEAAATMFRHLLTIPSTDRRVVRLLVADVGLTALDGLRERFCADELARWPNRARSGPRAAAAMWATSSALLALADAVTSGEIAERDATLIAVGIVRSTSAPLAVDA